MEQYEAMGQDVAVEQEGGGVLELDEAVELDVVVEQHVVVGQIL